MCGRHLKEERIIHRDIKHANILVLKKTKQIKICDFGLAKRSGEGEILSQGGTLAYMAPEIWWGWPQTSAVDVWAAALTIFEMKKKDHLIVGGEYFDDRQLLNIYRVLGEVTEDVGGEKYEILEQRLSDSQDLCDFLKPLLTYNPIKRQTAKEALLSPFIRRNASS